MSENWHDFKSWRDIIRLAPTEADAEEIAIQMDAQMEENYGLY